MSSSCKYGFHNFVKVTNDFKCESCGKISHVQSAFGVRK